MHVIHNNNIMLKKFFTKKKNKETPQEKQKQLKQAEQMMGGQMPEITDEMIDQMLAGEMPGMPKVGPMQKMAIKSLKKMSPQKRKEVFAQAMGKMQDKGGETKEEMLAQIEEMRAQGQINSKQYKIAKKRLGL